MLSLGAQRRDGVHTRGAPPHGWLIYRGSDLSEAKLGKTSCDANKSSA
jgi:hypothetical protein